MFLGEPTGSPGIESEEDTRDATAPADVTDAPDNTTAFDPIRAEPVPDVPSFGSDVRAAAVAAPVVDTLMPSLPARRRVAAAFALAALVPIVMSLRFLDGSAGGLGFAIAMWVAAFVALVAAARAFRVRIELSENRMVVSGWLMTSVFSRSEIVDIVIAQWVRPATPPHSRGARISCACAVHGASTHRRCSAETASSVARRHQAPRPGRGHPTQRRPGLDPGDLESSVGGEGVALRLAIRSGTSRLARGA